MSAAFVIAMFAVAISLGVVFMSVQASKNAASKKRDGGDGGGGGD